MKKQILPMILAGLLLTGTLLSAVSCAANHENPQGESRPAVESVRSESDTTASETEREILPITLPDDLDYEEDEIVIISRDREGWTRGEISVEKLNGDAINDAVYERNIAVENRLNIKINSVFDTNIGAMAPTSKVLLSVSAGVHEYDVMAAPCYGTMTPTLANNFADLGDLEYLDLDQPWWCQGFNDIVEYQGSRYAITGLGVLSQYRFAFATIFNHNLFEDAQVAFPYDDVRNGKWTLDRQISIVQTFHRDNGDGIVDTEGDVYGLLTAAAIGVDPYWSSCKIDAVTKNADGEYEVVFDIAKLSDVSDKILRLFHGSNQATYVFPDEGDNMEQEKIRAYFADGYAAMATLRIMELESPNLRNMKDTYGVLPMPKYDELQDDYHTFLHDQFTIFCIPNTIDEERAQEVGAFLEAFNYEGYRLVQPAYYETTLRTKLVQNPDSVEMMDTIVEGIRMELGIIYGDFFKGFHGDLRNMIQSENNTTASTFSKLVTKLEQRYVPQLISKLEKMQND